jgi:hypothetical protein
VSPVTDAHPVPPSRYDLLGFSYAEVIDATKHQDDKVGRLLGAIAFLTGGALVFANNDILSVDFELGESSYPLVAVTLATFILVDLVAVAAFMIAMSAPLTLPGRGTVKESHLFFLSIAHQRDASWRRLWAPEGLTGIEDELMKEIMNIAGRAEKKYRRSTIATNVFLAALVLLAPTVVLGVAAAAQPRSADPVDWTDSLRWSVGAALAMVVVVLLLALYFQARTSTKVDAKPLRVGVVCYPALLCMTVVAHGDSPLWAVLIAALGIFSALSFRSFHRPAARVQADCYTLAVVTIAGLSIAAWVGERGDLQLFLALLGGVLVVVPSIINELIAGQRSPDTDEVAS